MRIIARRTLRLFWARPKYSDAEQPLRAWFYKSPEGRLERPRESEGGVMEFERDKLESEYNLLIADTYEKKLTGRQNR